ncbi:MAG: ferritin-like domain-containing protein [Acidobacteriota bacterium]
MALTSMFKSKIDSLQDLYIDQLKDLYDAENQIIKALPQMIEAASSPDLKNALKHHLGVTRTQKQRLEQAFERLGQEAGAETCKGIRGIIEEGQDLMSRLEEPAVRDAGLIVAAQKVEHYEIAGYGGARAFANTLGYDDVVRLFQQTLDEEGEADKKLTQIAESHRNIEAKQTAGR